MTRLLYSVEESGSLLGGMSRTVLYEEIKAGRIAVVKVGRRSYISHVELERYVNSLTLDSAGAA